MLLLQLFEIYFSQCIQYIFGIKIQYGRHEIKVLKVKSLTIPS